MKNELNKPAGALAVLLIFAVILSFRTNVFAQPEKPAGQSEIVASGGSFTLEKAIAAGGGNQMSQSAFVQSGTTGQPVAGARSTGGAFSLYAGFWTPAEFAPTAASAVVGGRVLTFDGTGIRNVQLTITFPSGEIRTTKSSALGYYRFAEIPVGATYVIAVAAKKYSFSQPTQVRQVQDDVQDLDFIADAL